MSNEDKIIFIKKINKKGRRHEGVNELALELIKIHNFITIGDRTPEVYTYDNGMYRVATKLEIFAIINDILGLETGETLRNDIINAIKSFCYRTNNKDVFKTAPLNLINLRNGVYNTDTKELLPHDPKYYFAYRFPINYDPAQTCPTVSYFLENTFTEAQQDTIEEWIGYMFHRDYMIKKALVIVGEGDTGKTTFLEMIKCLIGPENISGVTLNQMSEDKFATQQMCNRHANIFDELSKSDVNDTTTFKMATGNGTMTGEQKFGERFQFVNYAKLTFACNEIPEVKDLNDEAYFNRWIVIRLEKTVERKILNYVKFLTTEEELSGLFNIAMKSLERLKEQTHFSYKNSGIDTKKEMMLGGSSVAKFATLRVEQAVGEQITKSRLFEIYEQFCIDNKLASVSKLNFGKKVKGVMPYVSETRQYNYLTKKQDETWANLKIIKTEEETLQALEEDNWFKPNIVIELP